ncbi:MAG: Lrp/AsnC family transcriptional regulator [Nanobdellota archaeon]
MALKLSKADRIMLAHLEWNARIPEKELARLTNLSKDGVRYRVRRLENKDVIQGYVAMIDHKRLNCESYKLYLKTQGTRAEIENIKQFFSNRQDVFAVFESRGNWNLAIALFLNSSHEYYALENDLLEQFGNIIIEKHFCQMVDATLNTGRSIYEDMSYIEYPLWISKQDVKMDDADHIILKELSKNAKLTLQELADKTGVSIETVMRKRKRLERDGVIALYSTTINYPLLDLEIYKVFITVKKYSSSIDARLIERLKTIPQLRNIVRMIGSWKLEVELTIHRYEEYEQFVEVLSKEFPDVIKEISFSIFRNERFNPDFDTK